MKITYLLIGVIFLITQACTEDKIEPQNTQAPNLKVGYHFDDISGGTVSDYSSTMVGVNIKNQKNNAIPSNLKLERSKFDTVITFNDSLSALNIPYGLGKFSNQFVIDFWINLKTQPTSEYRNIISETMAGSASTFRIGLEDNYVSFDFVQNPTITKGVKSTFRLNENSWYHLAFIYDGSDIKMFINGNLDASNSISMKQIDSWNNLNIGYFDDYYGKGLTFYGLLDEFRVWDHNFTDEEVKTLLMNNND